MRTFTYRAHMEPGDDPEIVVVTFPDVPEAITEGAGEDDARAQAEDALGTALLSYPMRGLPLPEPTAGPGPVITPAPDVAAKLAVLEAFAASGLTRTALARQLGVNEKEVRRILDPMHATKLPTLVRALAALGRRLVVGVEDMPAKAA